MIAIFVCPKQKMKLVLFWYLHKKQDVLSDQPIGFAILDEDEKELTYFQVFDQNPITMRTLLTLILKEQSLLISSETGRKWLYPEWDKDVSRHTCSMMWEVSSLTK